MNFKELIINNKQNVQNMIKLLTKENNEDLEQEVYIKILNNADKYKEQGNLKSWICTIAKNLSKDYLKSSKQKQNQNLITDDKVLASIKDKNATPESKLLQKIRQKRITQAILNLKPKLKEVILLCEIEDLSYEQVSKKLKIPIGTVKSRIYNAKKELALVLEDLL